MQLTPEQIYSALQGYESARTSPENIEDVLRAIGRLSASKPAAPEGWKLVPVEPTPEMLRAATMGSPFKGCNADFKETYAAMLAASPAAGSE